MEQIWFLQIVILTWLCVITFAITQLKDKVNKKK